MRFPTLEGPAIVCTVLLASLPIKSIDVKGHARARRHPFTAWALCATHRHQADLGGVHAAHIAAHEYAFTDWVLGQRATMHARAARPPCARVYWPAYKGARRTIAIMRTDSAVENMSEHLKYVKFVLRGFLPNTSAHCEQNGLTCMKKRTTALELAEIARCVARLSL